MIRVGIVGATGYTAFELIKLLLRHPQVTLTRLSSRDANQPQASEVHPQLRDRTELKMTPFEVSDYAQSVDFAFSCLPHAASAKVVAQLLDHGIRVVDFSADYRLGSVDQFESVYQTEHPDPERVGTVPYGMPELFREQIPQAPVVANPGCFPSSILLPVVPLMKAGLVEKGRFIADSKTGISGAGRKANLKFHFPECNDAVSAYGIGTHRHAPEIDDLIFRSGGGETNVIFTPHLIPMTRGILSTIYLHPTDRGTPQAIRDCWQATYGNCPFIRQAFSIPSTRDTSGTNFCDLYVTESQKMIVIVSVLDNLIKGASGAAVQNFNLMNGIEETTGLLA